jgi:ribosomal protein L11 methyltransferase
LRSLTVSVAPQDVEAVLDRLLLLAPRGVHELPGNPLAELLLYGEGEELAEAEEFAAGERLIERAVTADAPDDWRERRSYTHRPQQIGDRLLVRPAWATPASSDGSPARIEVVLASADAFGTGSHPTTRGCLEALESVAPGASLADLGCGSGVVAVAAALLGWSRVIAVDVSAASIEATRSNAALNSVELEALVLDLTREPPPTAQTLVANVPLSIHTEIASRIAGSATRAIIASGVPAERSAELLDAYAGLGLEPARCRALDGWAVAVFGESG